MKHSCARSRVISGSEKNRWHRRSTRGRWRAANSEKAAVSPLRISVISSSSVLTANLQAVFLLEARPSMALPDHTNSPRAGYILDGVWGPAGLAIAGTPYLGRCEGGGASPARFRSSG